MSLLLPRKRSWIQYFCCILGFINKNRRRYRQISTMLELVMTFYCILSITCLYLEVVLSRPKSVSALVDSVVEDNRQQLTVYEFPVYYVTHVFLTWHFFPIALPSLCCVIFGKIDSSALINSWIVDVEHSIVNICEFAFPLKLFNKSLWCTKIFWKCFGRRNYQVGRTKMSGPSFWKHERKDLTLWNIIEQLQSIF